MKVIDVARATFALMLLAPSSAFAAHAFDLDSHMPPHLAAIWMVNWFGIPKSDPQGGGLDPEYGNWLQTFPSCGLDDDPAQCADFQDAGRRRWIASKRRPLTGIYSSTGLTDESRKHIDLMLSCVRRPCDVGARLDAFVLQLDSVKFTSAHPQNKQSPSWDIAYRAVVAYLDEGDKAGMKGAVWVGVDSTSYWHFGSNYGLNDQTSRKAALTEDVADMATMAAAHPSAVSIDGRPLLAFYVDSALMTASEWQTVLDDARQASGIDFYALATTLSTPYFAAFDAISPWVNLGNWQAATGANLHDQAVSYAKKMHAQLLAALASNPGRVVFGGVAPGFDDFTENWGACTAREIPRDPAVLAGQMDYLTSVGNVRGVILDTWDDWTEGTEIEPDVVEGPAKLLQFKQLLGALYGESADPNGDQALAQRWLGYGEARNCCFEQGACEAGTPPQIDLSCPTGAEPSGGADGGALDEAGASGDAGEDDAGSSGGCGCNAARADGSTLGWLAVAVAAFASRWARRKRSTGGSRRAPSRGATGDRRRERLAR